MPFFSFGLLRFVPLKIWILVGGLTIIAALYWRLDYLKDTVDKYTAAVEVEQGRVNGNRELVEDLSRSDDQLMHDAHRRADEAHARFMRWLYRQTPPTNGKTPPGYVEHMNEVR